MICLAAGSLPLLCRCSSLLFRLCSERIQPYNVQSVGVSARCAQSCVHIVITQMLRQAQPLSAFLCLLCQCNALATDQHWEERGVPMKTKRRCLVLDSKRLSLSPILERQSLLYSLFIRLYSLKHLHSIYSTEQYISIHSHKDIYHLCRRDRHKCAQ